MGRNDIKIGNNNKIKNVNMAGENIDYSKEKHPFLNKIIIPIICTVVGGLILAIILFFIGL